jgi:hypothetical protein
VIGSAIEQPTWRVMFHSRAMASQHDWHNFCFGSRGSELHNSHFMETFPDQLSKLRINGPALEQGTLDASNGNREKLINAIG